MLPLYCAFLCGDIGYFVNYYNHLFACPIAMKSKAQTNEALCILIHLLLFNHNGSYLIYLCRMLDNTMRQTSIYLFRTYYRQHFEYD